MKFRLFALIALTGLALTPSAKADIWTYDITSTFRSVNVKFELPMFEQDVVDQTVFDISTSSNGAITGFNLSGGSAGCSVVGVSIPGPCLDFVASGGAGLSASAPFNGACTFIKTTSSGATTITVTDTPGSVPEPSAWSLLFIVLLGVGLVARRQTQRHSN